MEKYTILYFPLFVLLDPLLDFETQVKENNNVFISQLIILIKHFPIQLFKSAHESFNTVVILVFYIIYGSIFMR